jgi:uncharacterized protein (DUF2141 family)
LKYHFARTIACASLFAVSPAAQQGNGQFSLSGMVTNSLTGEPIKKALVRLQQIGDDLPARPHGGAPKSASPASGPSEPASWTVLADSGGAFAFNGLEAGEYAIAAEKPGFAEPPPDGGKSRAGPVKLRSSVSDVILNLAPLGVISGKVTDQYGQPMPHVSLLALSQRMQDGLRLSVLERSGVWTDARGVYRMWELAPGKYYVKAVGKRGGTHMYAGDMAPSFVAREGFASAYFGGGGNVDSASPIEVGVGSQATADIQLTVQRAYRIRGTVANAVPQRPVQFELLNGDEYASEGRVSVNGDTGRFEVLDVVPGSFTLVATQGDLRGETAVNVDSSDVNGVAVTLSEGVDIKVHQRTEEVEAGAREQIRPGAIRSGSGACSVSLQPSGRRPGKTYTAARDKESRNESTLKSVLPGSYRITFTCYGGYVRAVRVGDRDLLSNPVLDVAAGVALPPLEVDVAAGGGTVTGSVTVPESSIWPRPVVLLVPMFAAAAGPQTARLVPKDGSGMQFQLGGLAPGLYTAYAFSDRDEVEFRNQEFLGSLTGGVSVTVEQGGNTRITVSGAAR